MYRLYILIFFVNQSNPFVVSEFFFVLFEVVYTPKELLLSPFLYDQRKLDEYSTL